MTPATGLGFEIGKLYRVIDDEKSSFYKNGMIIMFVEDNDSHCPWFLYVSGTKGPSLVNTQQRIAVSLYGLEPVEPKETSLNNKALLLMYTEQCYPDDKVLNTLVESI